MDSKDVPFKNHEEEPEELTASAVELSASISGRSLA